MFGKRGYHGTSMDEIAAASGLSKGGLYHAYSSKDALFLALLDERIDDRIAQLQSAFAKPSGNESDTRAQAAAVISDYGESAKHNDEWMRLFFEAVTYAATKRTFRRELGARVERMRDALEVVISSQMRDLEFSPPVTARDLAIAINALSLGLTVERLATPDTVDDALFGSALGYLLRGIADEAQSPGGG